AAGTGARFRRGLPRRVRLEYALAAEPGERLETVTWQDEGGWACRILRTADDAERPRPPPPPGSPRVRPRRGAGGAPRNRHVAGRGRLVVQDPAHGRRRRSPPGSPRAGDRLVGMRKRWNTLAAARSL